MNIRLLVFSLNLGLSFAILVLYIGYFEAIILVLLLVTASVVAASREDLTELKSDRNMIFIMIGFAVVVFFAAASFSSPYSLDVFYFLVGSNFALLAIYSLMRIRSKRLHLSYSRRSS
jgi:L-lactate permease